MPGAMPRLGLGTYEHDDPEVCAASVRRALELGYGHVDTAQGYENEESIGRGIREADVDREDVFLATKLTTDNLAYDDVIHSTKESLDRLGVDTVDLLYVHWPTGTYEPSETLPALDELVDDGVVGAVGMSNFLPRQLETAIDRLDHGVAAHQVEMHPLLPQQELHDLAVEHGHYLVAYCPIARNRVADVPVLQEVAAAHDATPAQVSLAWLAAKENVVPIPKASSPDHIRENLAATALDLSDEEVARIDALGEERHERIVDFPSAPWNQ